MMYTNGHTMPFGQFEQVLKPIQNPDEEKGLFYESYGDDWKIVQKTFNEAPEKVWAVVDGGIYGDFLQMGMGDLRFRKGFVLTAVGHKEYTGVIVPLPTDV
jgi:Trk K+ transport system NAD-binding subunit